MAQANKAAFNLVVKSIKRPLAASAGFLNPRKVQHPVFAHLPVDANSVHGADHGAAVAAGTG